MQRGLQFWAATAAVALAVCGCSHKPIAHLTDHSSLNLVTLSDGVHPWLTLNLLHDPTDTDLNRVRWSPGGKTLAYLDGDSLYTWNPSNTVQLNGAKHWDGPFWSPDGQSIALTSVEKTVILNARTLAIQQQFNGEQIVWWTGGRLCYSPRVFAAKRHKDDVQRVAWGSADISLPPGLSLVAAAPDGAVLLAQTNFAGQSADGATFVLLGIDSHSGAIAWAKPAPTLATRNYENPDISWNDRLQMAAAAMDAGGGFDIHGFVESGRGTMELKFAQAANHSWLSGPMSWIGDNLFAPLTLASVTQSSSQQLELKFWNELALFDGRTGELHTVSTGLPFEAAAACDDYVALVVREDDQAKIVITPWTRDRNGTITGVTFKPAEPPAQNVAAANLKSATS